jgi:peroxiredoxin
LEQGAIDDLARDYSVITVATNSGDAEQLRDYLSENELSFPVLLDETGMLASRWQVSGVPASFVVDARGEIRHAVFGLSTGLGLRARLWLVE